MEKMESNLNNSWLLLSAMALKDSLSHKAESVSDRTITEINHLNNVNLLACLISALKATWVQPMVALRNEQAKLSEAGEVYATVNFHHLNAPIS